MIRTGPFLSTYALRLRNNDHSLVDIDNIFFDLLLVLRGVQIGGMEMIKTNTNCGQFLKYKNFMAVCFNSKLELDFFIPGIRDFSNKKEQHNG